MLNDQHVEIHGDGQQTRSFTFVSDTVDGIVRAIECDEAAGEVFNIGSDAEISIVNLAHLIARLLGRGEGTLRFVPYSSIGKGPYEDVRRRIPDLTKSSSILG